MLDYNLAYIIQDNLNYKIYMSVLVCQLSASCTQESGVSLIYIIFPPVVLYSHLFYPYQCGIMSEIKYQQKKTVCMLSDKKIEGAFQNIQWKNQLTTIILITYLK